MGSTLTEIATGEAEPRDLSHLKLPKSIDRVINGLCDLKLDMDRYSRNLVGQPFLDDWMGTKNTCAYCGDSFLRLILPFMGWEDVPSYYYKAYVNPQHVLGASIKGKPEHVKPEQVNEKIARYASHFGSTDNAAYIWIKPLGIFWAHEGKHRVAFMRAHNQQTIAAWVREAIYPEADRLALIRPTDDRDEWLALLDRRYLQVLRRPQTTRLLLEAYGVKTLRWNELSNVPGECAVRQEIYQQRLHLSPRTTAENERTLDVEALRGREQGNHRIVTRTVLDMEPHRFGWRRFVFYTAAFFGLGLVLSVLGHHWVRSAGFLLLGVSFGLLLSLNVIQLFGPKNAGVIRT